MLERALHTLVLPGGRLDAGGTPTMSSTTEEPARRAQTPDALTFIQMLLENSTAMVDGDTAAAAAAAIPTRSQLQVPCEYFDILLIQNFSGSNNSIRFSLLWFVSSSIFNLQLVIISSLLQVVKMN